MAVLDDVLTCCTLKYNVYINGDKLIGTASVDLPEISQTTVEMTGSSIGGKLNVPLIGHFEPLTLTCHFSEFDNKLAHIFAQKTCDLTLRLAKQTVNRASTELGFSYCAWYCKAYGVKLTSGTLKSGESSEATVEFSLPQLKIEQDSKTILEIDILNSVFRSGDQDIFSDINANI